ncbi:MAG: zf-HC2 domain-containing protein [Proteobacteria bacterium]|nr:zf-HC2 domain-containing protein [Pseudomonadota bacterium]
MPNTSESQCYFVQLQIDSYLDGDLASVQQQEFMSHLKRCEACTREFRFAQTLLDTVMDLQQLDCDEQVMEPIYRLANGGKESGQTTQGVVGSSWAAMVRWFNTGPLFLRYSLPIAAVAVLATVLLLSISVLNPAGDRPAIAQQAGVAPAQELAQLQQYDPAEIRQAVEDLNLAIEYLNQIGRRTDALISDRFLLRPLQDTLNASFERAASRNQERTLNDPI